MLHSLVRTFRGGAAPFSEARNVPQHVFDSLEEQAAIEPLIYSVGAKTLPGLRIFESGNVRSRIWVDIPRLQSQLRQPPDALLVLPQLVVGGAELYAANLAASLREIGQRDIAVLVTEQPQSAGGKALTNTALAPLAESTLIWRHAIGADYPYFFARMLNIIGAKSVFVINSRHGLDALALSAPGLSHRSRLFAAFFSMGYRGLGAPYGLRYPQRMSRHVTLLTDNAPMRDQLAARVLPDRNIALLRNRISAHPAEHVERQLTAMNARRQAGSRPHWVWVGRVEPMKGTKLLGEIARRRPHDLFTVFGPTHGHLDDLGLKAPNIEYRGVIDDVHTFDFTPFDGYVFTSLFEGMPNSVLEMAQHGLPLILADVGGLRETFADVATLVAHRSDMADTAADFASALEDALSRSPSEAVRAAWKRVADLHSADAHREALRALLSPTS